jgi:hypothetical protein
MQGYPRAKYDNVSKDVLCVENNYRNARYYSILSLIGSCSLLFKNPYRAQFLPDIR